MKIAIIGATGIVGLKMIRVLEERFSPDLELILAASEQSIGKQLQFNGREITVCSIPDAIQAKPDIALFSAGYVISREFAPKFAAQKTYVIDNSSAWRMEKDIPLVVPEVNPDAIQAEDYIIANPNCSTIQLVHVLWPLHKNYRLKRVVVSTYQSVTGSGHKGVGQLFAERHGERAEMVYPHPIDLNCLPHGGAFQENGYTREEEKLVQESRKIMNVEDLRLTATAVRVPVAGGHSESVNAEFQNPLIIDNVRKVLAKTPGVTVLDDPSQNLYPMPLYVEDKEGSFVGRIRRDDTVPHGINLWIVADNLRKGAATNSVQIAEYIANTFLNA